MAQVIPPFVVPDDELDDGKWLQFTGGEIRAMALPAAPPSDAGADVASLRTLGTGAQQAAAGTHSHDLEAALTSLGSTEPVGAGTGKLWWDSGSKLLKVNDGDSYETIEDHVPSVFLTPVGDTGKAIYHGKFWDQSDTDLGQFVWEAWVCPLGGSGGSNRYWIVEGAGANHCIACSPVNALVYNGSTDVTVAADYTPEVGEWVHSMLAWDGTNLRIYINGIVAGVTAFTGDRRTLANRGELFIGGIGSGNFEGRIAAVRGWESASKANAVDQPYFASSFEEPFTPARTMAPFGPVLSGTVNVEKQAVFAADLTFERQVIDDLSAGWGGRRHPGLLTGAALGFTARPSGFFVKDPTCPLRFDAAVTPTRTVGNAPATPVGAKVFDSFQRANSLLVWGSPQLGTTEAGSLGALAWQYSSGDLWGILDGWAVFQGAGAGMAWVLSNSPNMEVRVDRRQLEGLHNTGLVARLVDANNYLYVYTSGTLAGTTVTARKVVGGVDSALGSPTAAPSAWQTLRMTCSGNTLTVYCDSTQLFQLTDAANNTGQGAGLFSQSASTARRWDNFTVI